MFKKSLKWLRGSWKPRTNERAQRSESVDEHEWLGDVEEYIEKRR